MKPLTSVLALAAFFTVALAVAPAQLPAGAASHLGSQSASPVGTVVVHPATAVTDSAVATQASSQGTAVVQAASVQATIEAQATQLANAQATIEAQQATLAEWATWGAAEAGREATTQATIEAQATQLADSLADSDADGLTDYLESIFIGTSPTAEDSDGDGVNDGYEILWCYTDPLDPASYPLDLSTCPGGPHP